MILHHNQTISSQIRKVIGIVLILLFSQSTALLAQISAPGTPPSFTHELVTNIPLKIMPLIDRAALEAEDAIDRTNGVPPRFGKAFEVNYSLTNSGSWTDLPDGGRVWRLRIYAPGAYSINLIYSSFWMPPGGEFYIYNEDRSMVLGAFTEQNNKVHGKFATGLVQGEASILEYYEPRAVRGTGTGGLMMVVGVKFIKVVLREPQDDIIREAPE